MHTRSTLSSTCSKRCSSSASTKTIFDLACGETGVYGYHDQPCRRYGEGPLQHRRDVRAEEGDPVVLLEACVLEARGEAVDPFFELPVGVAPFPMDHGGLVGEHVGAAPEEAHRRKLRAVDLLVHQRPFPFVLEPGSLAYGNSIRLSLRPVPPSRWF